MPALVTVIDSTTDLTELCYTFQTLVRAKGFPTAPILAFHGVPLDVGALDTLASCTNRSVTFINIQTFYHVFPDNFTPTPGKDYSQQQTELFFASDIWTLPHMESHDVIFRFTDTTCFTSDNTDMPDFSSNAVPVGVSKEAVMYQSQMIPGMFVMGHKFIAGLYESTVDFMNFFNIQPKNPELWALVEKNHLEYNSLPKFESSFEIVRKEFMMRSDVRTYHHFIVHKHSEEFFNNHWSVEVIRFLTMAIYSSTEECSVVPVSGYMEKDFLKEKRYPGLGVCRLGPVGSRPEVTA